MGWFSSALQVVGLGADLYGTFAGAGSAEDTAEAQANEYRATAAANAELSRYDANVERLNAIEASYSTNQVVAKHRADVERFVGKQEATYSKSGVVVGTGTPLEVGAKTIQNAMLDEVTIRHEGAKKEQLHKTLAQRYDLLAEKGLREGASYANLALQAGADQAQAYLIGGIGTAAEKAYNLADDFGWFD